MVDFLSWKPMEVSLGFLHGKVVGSLSTLSFKPAKRKSARVVFAFETAPVSVLLYVLPPSMNPSQCLRTRLILPVLDTVDPAQS